MTPEPDAGDRSHAGQAIYTPAILAIYDLWVLGLSNSAIWRCPTRHILDHYNRHVANEHLDVGVGTGWFLAHCRFPSRRPRLGLLDLNAHSLAAASRRVARFAPERYQTDVLRPLSLPAPPFASIGLSYLLHCLPGRLAEKAVVFDNLLPHLRPTGVMFGATLLSGGVPLSRVAQALMRAYNRKGIFSNADDTLADLRDELTQRFARVELNVVGCCALFAAQEPRPAQRC